VVVLLSNEGRARERDDGDDRPSRAAAAGNDDDASNVYVISK